MIHETVKVGVRLLNHINRQRHRKGNQYKVTFFLNLYLFLLLLGFRAHYHQF